MIKKKIALLNFPFDNNYGGNLQRFALMQVLQEMGSDVTHLQTVFHEYVPGRFPLYTILKRIGRILLKGSNEDPFREIRQNLKYKKENKTVIPFYEKYVKHTKPIKTYQELQDYNDYEAYIVGSDQVWRRTMSFRFPFSSMFLDFVKDKAGIKRIAYGVSFGTAKDEIPAKEKPNLAKLYSLFDSVSVREDSALELLNQYGWNIPKAIQVLDPTLLLAPQKYNEVINNGNTRPLLGDMFCYVLDKTRKIDALVEEIASKNHLTPFKTSIDYAEMVSVEQWLRSFRDAKYIVTDSFHGFVFSIIFNKPVKLVYNKRRGNERFESLKRLLCYNPDDDIVDWDSINDKIQFYTNISKKFLKESLGEIK